MITKALATAGMGDALNLRAFLVTYCKQKNIPFCNITIYTPKYWWLFEGIGFKRTMLPPKSKDIVGYRNFGNYDLPKTYSCEELDKCIARNAGITFAFETCVPLPKFKEPNISLPEKFITFNNGYGDLSGQTYKNPDVFCLKSWPNEYWEEFVRKIGIPCVQIGAGTTCVPIKGISLNLINQLSIKQSAEVMRKAMFHIDMEGGLTALNQHLGKRSVVLFGPCAIQNQGREFNLNINSGVCFPCYEWGGRLGRLHSFKSTLVCGHRCMRELKPDFVINKIKKSGWLEYCPPIENKYMEVI